jgi:hypothetical protein
VVVAASRQDERQRRNDHALEKSCESSTRQPKKPNGFGVRRQ